MHILRTSLLALSIGSLPAHAQDAVKYEYDALGRLVTVENTQGPNKGTVSSYTLDRAGNRTIVKTKGALPQILVVPLNGLTIIPIRQFVKFSEVTSGSPSPSDPDTPSPTPPPTPAPTPSNAPPVANPDTVNFPCTTFKNVDLLSNDTDPENNLPLHLISATSDVPELIWIVCQTSTSVRLASTQAGTYYLSYIVADSLGATATGTLRATVTGTKCKIPPE